MTLWKPHALANPHQGQINLRVGDKVVAKDGIDGAPEGTEGKVILANGFNWLRYRVLFSNGQERQAFGTRSKTSQIVLRFVRHR
jgi:hypothetical protein